MNRTHTTCCALIASALVLAGLLAVCVGQRTTANEAHAEMVIAGEALTMMTAQTRNGEESFFVLDNSTASLIVYRLDITSDSLEPAAGINLDDIFSGNSGRRGNRGNRR